MQSTNPKHRAYGRPQGRCKVCVREQTGAYQRANRSRASAQQRTWRLKNEFGITDEEYEQLLSVQGGVCGICGGPPDGRWKRLHVDHCHTTGRVRGLLCTPCNQGLGLLRDSVERIHAAIAYLEARDAR